MLLAVGGLVPGPSDQASDTMHVVAWREAYRGFGAKPQRTGNSVEALRRAAGPGLPRVNRLTDLYNAVSVLHQIPLAARISPATPVGRGLIRATGTRAVRYGC